MNTPVYATSNEPFNSGYKTFNSNGEIINTHAFTVNGLKVVTEGYVRLIFQNYMFSEGYQMNGGNWIK